MMPAGSPTDDSAPDLEICLGADAATHRHESEPDTERATEGADERVIELPEGLLDHLGRTRETVRSDVVARARARLAEGQRPSAADVAASVVQHLVAGRAR